MRLFQMPLKRTIMSLKKV